jgi:hypothetical protein
MCSTIDRSFKNNRPQTQTGPNPPKIQSITLAVEARKQGKKPPKRPGKDEDVKKNFINPTKLKKFEKCCKKNSDLLKKMAKNFIKSKLPTD